MYVVYSAVPAEVLAAIPQQKFGQGHGVFLVLTGTTILRAIGTFIDLTLRRLSACLPRGERR